MPPQPGEELQGAFEKWLRSADEKRLDADECWTAAPRHGSHFATCVKTFGLDALEERILAAVWAAHGGSRPVVPEQLARIASVSSAVIEGKLGPEGKLVRHGLVELTQAPSGRSPLELGVGLAGRLAERRCVWLDGVTQIPGPAEHAAAAQKFSDRFAVGPRLQDSIKFFVGHETRLAMVSGATARDAFALGAAVGRKLNRAVVLVDGVELAARPDRRAALRALRRDAELDGSVLVLHQALALRDAWSVLRQALADAATKPLCVLVCDEGELPFLPIAPGDEYPRVLEIRLGKAEAPTLATTATATATAAPSLGDPAPRPDPFAPYRQQAAADAERAMGTNSVDVRQAASSAMRMPTPSRTTMPPPDRADLPKPAPVEVAPAAPVPAPAVAVAPPAEAPAPALAPVAEAAPLPDEKSDKKAKKGKKSKKAENAPSADASPAAVAAPEPSPAAASEPPPAPPQPPQPPLEVPKNATPRILAQICMTSPNPEQRIELMAQIAGLKDPFVVAALRANAKSEHAGVRAAAETVMQGLFGPNWNAQRSIPKPVQPPRSDDDRGPPGY